MDERHKGTLRHSEQDKLTLEERLTAANRIVALHKEQCQHSFEQSALGEITQEKLKMVLAEKRTAEQEVLAIEAEIEQFERGHQKHACIAHAKTDEGCFKKAITEYLQSVTVYSTGSVTVQWLD